MKIPYVRKYNEFTGKDRIPRTFCFEHSLPTRMLNIVNSKLTYSLKDVIRERLYYQSKSKIKLLEISNHLRSYK